MSSTHQMSKFEKEKQKLVQEKSQTLLNEMLRDEDNKYCVDCDAKGPRWASWNLGIFLCIRCAGIHRNLGVHISKVRSVNLDTWTPDQVVAMQQMGNSRARAVYEANLPDNFRRPQTDATLETFIRAKYEHKKYIAHEWVKPTLPKVNWDSEIEESLRKKKEVKKQQLQTEIGTLPAVAKPKPAISSSGPSVVKAKPKAASPGNIDPTALISGDKEDLSSSVANDLIGLSLSDPASSNTSGNLLDDPFLSPQKSATGINSISSNADDLNSMFLNDGGSSSGLNQKMTNQSILSLYGSSSAAPAPLAGGGTGNPFATPNAFGVQQNIMTGSTNPFPQMSTFNPMAKTQQHSLGGNFMASPNAIANGGHTSGPFDVPLFAQQQRFPIPRPPFTSPSIPDTANIHSILGEGFLSHMIPPTEPRAPIPRAGSGLGDFPLPDFNNLAHIPYQQNTNFSGRATTPNNANNVSQSVSNGTAIPPVSTDFWK